MIKKVLVGTEPIKISEGSDPKTLIIYNNGTAIIYLASDPMTKDGGIPIAPASSYANDYAKGDYYLYSATAGQDVRVETK